MDSTPISQEHLDAFPTDRDIQTVCRDAQSILKILRKKWPTDADSHADMIINTLVEALGRHLHNCIPDDELDDFADSIAQAIKHNARAREP